MSTLNVSNISDGTDTVATGYVVNGSAKAWVNFNGGGTAAIRDSANITSLTDNGTGDYSLNFTNSFGAGNYSVGSFCAYSLGGGVHSVTGDNTTGDPTSSNIRVRTKNQASTIINATTIGLNMMGDLA